MSAPPAQLPLAYHLTWRTYGTWLHGADPHSVDRRFNEWETPKIPPNGRLNDLRRSQMSQPYFELCDSSRAIVERVISEVAMHRRWTVLATNVRTNHVHIVVRARVAPEIVMGDFKRWSTRRLREAGLVAPDRHVWAEHGSTRYKWDAAAVAEAVDYVLKRQ